MGCSYSKRGLFTVTDETLLHILRSKESSREDAELAFSRLFISAKDAASASEIVKIFLEHHPKKAKQFLHNIQIPPEWLPEDFSESQ